MDNEITAQISDERAPVDFEKQAAEVRALHAAFDRAENNRVPVTFGIDEQFWLMRSKYNFLDFYKNPMAHLTAQLEGNLWFANNVIGDMVPGIPDHWDVRTVHWMEENEFFGCDVAYQENDYAWAKPLTLSKQDLLKHIADIDPDAQVRKNSAYRLYLALKDLTDGKTFAGRPINVIMPGMGTQGIFTKAGEIRGLEQLCMDLYDDPEWAAEYLALIADQSIARSKAWYRLIHGKEHKPSEAGFLTIDDSLQMISAELFEQFVLPCQERYYQAFTTGWRGIHLCGYSTQHYKVLHDKLGVTVFDGPGIFADHARYFRELGPDIKFITARFDNSVLGMGSGQELEDMVKKLLHPGTKLPGRFMLSGYVHRLTRLENIAQCYRLVKKYGVIEG